MAHASRRLRRERRLKRERSLAFRMAEIALKQRDEARQVAALILNQAKKELNEGQPNGLNETSNTTITAPLHVDNNPSGAS